jgi:hypothetical protein
MKNQQHTVATPPGSINLKKKNPNGKNFNSKPRLTIHRIFRWGKRESSQIRSRNRAGCKSCGGKATPASEGQRERWENMGTREAYVLGIVRDFRESRGNLVSSVVVCVVNCRNPPSQTILQYLVGEDRRKDCFFSNGRCCQVLVQTSGVRAKV